MHGWSSTYPSCPWSANFPYIFSQNVANHLHDKQKVGSARGVTHPAGSLFCDSRVTLLALGLTFLDGQITKFSYLWFSNERERAPSYMLAKVDFAGEQTGSQFQPEFLQTLCYSLHRKIIISFSTFLKWLIELPPHSFLSFSRPCELTLD